MSYENNYDDYLSHPVFKAVRAVAMKRAGGLCSCGAPASEVHHVEREKWGLFDGPENLRPICHPCHCKEHGKPS